MHSLTLSSVVCLVTDSERVAANWDTTLSKRQGSCVFTGGIVSILEYDARIWFPKLISVRVIHIYTVSTSVGHLEQMSDCIVNQARCVSEQLHLLDISFHVLVKQRNS